MQVKKFVGPNTAVIMAKIRKEFGEDAIILQTNKIKTGGVLGFFQKEEIEILAALDNEVRNSPSKRAYRSSSDSSNEYVDFKSHITNMNDISKNSRKDMAIESTLSGYNKSQPIMQEKASEKDEVKEDIDEIKKTVLNLSKKINDTFKTPQEEEEIKKEEENINKLLDIGISHNLSKEIVTNLKKNGRIVTKDNLMTEILNIIRDSIKIDVPKTNKYIVFIGSTGIGKTTTLAKIASTESIDKNKKIGFLTLDTYRISAVEQLKTYAEILGAPIEVAYEIQDLISAIERLSNRELIFIDTAGRSHNNKGQVEDLKKVLENIPDKSVYLVLSANMQLKDIYDIIETYDFLTEYDIIVTKMDETKRHGNLLDIMKKTGKKIKYTAFGQNVPDDIEEFDLNRYVSELVGEIDNAE